MASVSSSVKGSTSRRFPNAFLIFVREKSQELQKTCSDDEKATMGSYLGRKWKSMPFEEKQVYFEKYKALKALEGDKLDSDPSMVDASLDQVNMKLKPGRKPASARQKPSKKPRRSPNAFMIFSKEQRHTIDPSYKKDKKCHKSTILSSMWKELPPSEKEKYFTEAKRLLSLYELPEQASPRKIPKKKNKAESEIAPEKSVGRRRKKKTEVPCSDATNLQNQEVIDDGKSEIESNSNKPSENVENAGTVDKSSEPHTSSIHQHGCTMGHLHHMTSSVETRHSNNPCMSCLNSDASTCQNSNLGFPGMARSCFGTPPFPPLCCPFNVSPWMHHHWLPYPPPSFYPSPYSYYSPYSYNNTYNSYINYYEAQYYRRGVEPISHGTPNVNSPATATSGNTREESAEAEETDENSNDEQLIVDDGESSGN